MGAGGGAGGSRCALQSRPPPARPPPVLPHTPPPCCLATPASPTCLVPHVGPVGLSHAPHPAGQETRAGTGMPPCKQLGFASRCPLAGTFSYLCAGAKAAHSNPASIFSVCHCSPSPPATTVFDKEPPAATPLPQTAGKTRRQTLCPPPPATEVVCHPLHRLQRPLRPRQLVLVQEARHDLVDDVIRRPHGLQRLQPVKVAGRECGCEGGGRGWATVGGGPAGLQPIFTLSKQPAGASRVCQGVGSSRHPGKRQLHSRTLQVLGTRREPRAGSTCAYSMPAPACATPPATHCLHGTRLGFPFH